MPVGKSTSSPGGSDTTNAPVKEPFRPARSSQVPSTGMFPAYVNLSICCFSACGLPLGTMADNLISFRCRITT